MAGAERTGLALPFFPLPFFGSLRQYHVADGDAQHDPLALRVAKMMREIASLLCSCSPYARIVDAARHDHSSRAGLQKWQCLQLAGISGRTGLLRYHRLQLLHRGWTSHLVGVVAYGLETLLNTGSRSALAAPGQLKSARGRWCRGEHRWFLR